MTKGRIRKKTDQVEVGRTEDQESGGWTRRLAILGRAELRKQKPVYYMGCSTKEDNDDQKKLVLP